MIFLARHPTLYRLWSSMKVCMIKSIDIGDHTKICFSNIKGWFICRKCQLLFIISYVSWNYYFNKWQSFDHPWVYSSLLGRGPKFCPGSIDLLRFSKFRRGGAKNDDCIFLVWSLLGKFSSPQGRDPANAWRPYTYTCMMINIQNSPFFSFGRSPNQLHILREAINLKKSN